MPILDVQQISKQFRGFSALSEVSLTAEQGETIAIIGASGSGKSTLLRCIGNLERVDSGGICIAGDYLAKDEGGGARYPNERTCRQIARKTGMVFQQFHLFPHLTCLENITIAPIRVLGQDRLSAEQRAKELLALVGLSHRADSFPAQLSGGQQQRVAIARALALDPAIMLFDEPTSALDPELTGEVMAVITQLAQRDMTMLIVTHEMEFARRTADRVLFFESGRIAAQDTPERFFGAQQNERIRRFLAGGAL